MALIKCPECQREISADALACPGCGKPNKAGVNRSKDSSQHAGCFIMVAALFVGGFVSGPIGGVVFLVGLILVALNTRFS